MSTEPRVKAAERGRRMSQVESGRGTRNRTKLGKQSQQTNTLSRGVGEWPQKEHRLGCDVESFHWREAIPEDMGVFGEIDEDGNEFLNLHGRAGDVRLVASAPALPDVPEVSRRPSFSSTWYASPLLNCLTTWSIVR